MGTPGVLRPGADLRSTRRTNRLASIGMSYPKWLRKSAVLRLQPDAQSLIPYEQYRARGIRTVVARFPTNRISRKRTEPGWHRLEPSPEYAPTHRTDSNRLAPTPNWHRRWHHPRLRIGAALPHRLPEPAVTSLIARGAREWNRHRVSFEVPEDGGVPTRTAFSRLRSPTSNVR
jgi:hypothetical protein